MPTRRQKLDIRIENFAADVTLITKAKIPCNFINHGQTVLFREEGMPKVDYYPASGKWRAGGQEFDGGAQKFLDWYKEQRKV